LTKLSERFIRFQFNASNLTKIFKLKKAAPRTKGRLFAVCEV